MLPTQRVRLDVVPSTQDIAKSNFSSLKRDEWRVYTANGQTTGRGTHGRPWISFHGKSVLASYIFNFSNDSGQIRYISQIAALTISECLMNEKVESSVKWVNDILVNGRKVSGVLTEVETNTNTLFYVCVGIGINVNVPSEAFNDQKIDQPATSLMSETGREFNLDNLINSLSERLRHNITKLETQNYFVFRETVSKNLEKFDGKFIVFDTEPLVATSGKERYIQGVVVGVDEHGSLILKDASGKMQIFINGRILKKCQD